MWNGFLAILKLWQSCQKSEPGSISTICCRKLSSIFFTWKPSLNDGAAWWTSLVHGTSQLNYLSNYFHPSRKGILIPLMLRVVCKAETKGLTAVRETGKGSVDRFVLVVACWKKTWCSSKKSIMSESFIAFLSHLYLKIASHVEDAWFSQWSQNCLLPVIPSIFSIQCLSERFLQKLDCTAMIR